jgi:hypothetical protein
MMQVPNFIFQPFGERSYAWAGVAAQAEFRAWTGYTNACYALDQEVHQQAGFKGA